MGLLLVAAVDFVPLCLKITGQSCFLLITEYVSLLLQLLLLFVRHLLNRLVLLLHLHLDVLEVLGNAAVVLFIRISDGLLGDLGS